MEAVVPNLKINKKTKKLRLPRFFALCYKCILPHFLKTQKFTYEFAIKDIKKSGWIEETKGEGDFVCPTCQLMKAGHKIDSRKGRLWLAATRLFEKKYFSHNSNEEFGVSRTKYTRFEKDEYAMCLLRRIRKIIRRLKRNVNHG